MPFHHVLDVHVYFCSCDGGFSSSSINLIYQLYVTSRTALSECVVCELVIKENHVDLHPFRISAVKQVNDLPVVFLCFVASGVGCVPSYYM
jgi:hypothetical protein